MYLARKGNIQFYINDEKFDVMNADGYELYKITEVAANDAAKNAETVEPVLEVKGVSEQVERSVNG